MSSTTHSEPPAPPTFPRSEMLGLAEAWAEMGTGAPPIITERIELLRTAVAAYDALRRELEEARRERDLWREWWSADRGEDGKPGHRTASARQLKIFAAALAARNEEPSQSQEGLPGQAPPSNAASVGDCEGSKSSATAGRDSEYAVTADHPPVRSVAIEERPNE